MGIIELLLWISAGVGIAVTIFFIILLAIQILILYGAYKLATKKPWIAIFLLVLVLVVATAECFTPATIAFGISAWIGALISIKLSYKKLKKAFK